MVEIKIESPIRIEKRTNKIIIDQALIPVGGCKIIDIKEGLFKSGKYSICNEGGKIFLTPLKPSKLIR